MDNAIWEVECQDSTKYLVKAVSYEDAVEKVRKAKTKEFSAKGESEECGSYWRIIVGIRRFSHKFIE